MPQQELYCKTGTTDFLLGGVSCAVSKTLTAPTERVQPRMLSRISGVVRCHATLALDIISLAFTSERTPQQSGEALSQTASRPLPTQAFNLPLSDCIKKTVPQYSPKQDFGLFVKVTWHLVLWQWRAD